MVICTLFDPQYLPHAEALIKSLATHCPHHDLYVMAVNLTPATCRMISTWHPRLTMRPHSSADITTLKPTAMLDAIKTYDQPVLFLDADTIVRGPLSVIQQTLKDHDLTVLHRPTLRTRGPLGTDHAAKFNAGVIGVKNCWVGRNYLANAEGYLKKHLTLLGGDKQLLDQEAFYLVFERFRNDLLFAPLPATFNDCRFSPNSTIWHGKGSAKRHILFRVESLHYVHGWPWDDVSHLLQFLRRAGPIRSLYRQYWQRFLTRGPT